MGKTLLVAAASAFSRGLIRSSLDMAGYRVREAGNLEEAMREMEQQRADVVLAALSLPPDGAAALCAALRGHPEWGRIPFLALADSPADIQSPAARAADFEDCQPMFDREAVLASVARLASTQASDETAPASAPRELACAGGER